MDYLCRDDALRPWGAESLTRPIVPALYNLLGKWDWDEYVRGNGNNPKLPHFLSSSFPLQVHGWRKSSSYLSGAT